MYNSQALTEVASDSGPKIQKKETPDSGKKLVIMINEAGRGEAQFKNKNAMASLMKRATASGAFVSYKYQPHRYLSARVFIVIKNQFLGKRATANDAFQ
jgi:hypothetical protein